MSSEGAPLAAAVTGGDEQLPNADLLEHAHDLLSDADESWQRGVLELEAALVDVDRRFAEVRTRWVERRKPREAEFDEALRQLQERMPDVDPERYLDVERRIEQLTPLGAARKQLRKDPLLVDQPEDDLDNRFIYDDVVKCLREAKPFRQFLIATHNANIPVLGDAEQIITLDADERGDVVSSKVRARGSIDDSTVRDSAEHILEGGREAFELRSRKYHA